jgi:aldehyde:ferredoxin oxidoreductase
VCTFLDGTIRELYPAALGAVLGSEFSADELARTGERIYTLERSLNIQRGVNASQDVLPRRLLQGMVSPDKYQEGMKIYYHIRDWDAQGHPSAQRLTSLGLEFLV